MRDHLDLALLLSSCDRTLTETQTNRLVLAAGDGQISFLRLDTDSPTQTTLVNSDFLPSCIEFMNTAKHDASPRFILGYPDGICELWQIPHVNEKSAPVRSICAFPEMWFAGDGINSISFVHFNRVRIDFNET